VSLAHPRHAAQFLRTVRWQAAAGKTRKEWRERGVPVPPIVIFSITHRCNLRCVGCYAYALHGGLEADSPPGEAVGESAHAEPVADDTLSAKELTADKLESIVAEAVDLGVSFFVIAGGEPFMRPELLDIAERSPP
jgi:MoaA/NifB/PqqE/SkfB family radical SAM enzyme